MKGDFTRVTFDPAKHFSRVLMQQGRVTLDADYNEQMDILLHYVRSLARDLIGPYAAPIEDAGFKLRLDKEDSDLWIGKGRYYVDGILVENDGCFYAAQPDPPLSAKDGLPAEIKDKKGQAIWIYLDVWERHISFIEDDAVREKALSGSDTCTRAKIVWQVKALPVSFQTGEISNEDRVAHVKAMLHQRDLELTKQEEDATTAWRESNASNKEELGAKLELIKWKGGAVKTMIALDVTGTDATVIRGNLTTRLNQSRSQLTILPEPDKSNMLAAIEEYERAMATLSGTDAGAMKCDAPVAQLSPVSKAWLTARVDPGQKTDNACVTPPDSKYRGTENQLYRVEIHDGGTADTAMFKWSRDNGSIATTLSTGPVIAPRCGTPIGCTG